MSYTIQVETQPKPEDIQFLWGQLLIYNRPYAQVNDYQGLTIVARNPAGDIVDGLIVCPIF